MNVSKKILAILCTIAVLVTAISVTLIAVSASAMDGLYAGKNCTENSDGSVSVGNNGSYALSDFIRFSEGEEASITISVEEMGSTWNENGIFITVSPTQEVTPWPEKADGTFAYAFHNDNNVMKGMIYRYGANSSQSGSDFATASLSGDITISIKKIGDQVKLLLNDLEWNAGYIYGPTGFTIPDGYLGIATTAGSKVTVKNVLYTATNCTANLDGSVSVGNNGSYALSDFTRFSKGEEASITISAEEMGNTWNENGFFIVVSPKVKVDPLSNAADKTFAYAFYNDNNVMKGTIYRYGANSSQGGADFATAPLSGDITIRIKKIGDQVKLLLNELEWNAGYIHGPDGFTIPDGYLSIVTTAGCKLKVKSSSTSGTTTTTEATTTTTQATTTTTQATTTTTQATTTTTQATTTTTQATTTTTQATTTTAGATTTTTVVTGEKKYTEEDWILSEGVTVNANGTLSISMDQYVVLDELIDFTDPNLDVSVTFTVPYDNANQFLSLFLSKEKPTSFPENAADVLHTRHGLDNLCYGIMTFIGDETLPYGGGYVDVLEGDVTVHFKRVNDLVRVYMDDILIHQSEGQAENKVSDCILGIGQGYLSMGVKSSEGPITATILEVNGMVPVAKGGATTTTTGATTTTTADNGVSGSTTTANGAGGSTTTQNGVSSSTTTVNTTTAQEDTSDNVDTGVESTVAILLLVTAVAFGTMVLTRAKRKS